jgi:energy-coupling factor transporter ATP-binding protein EcfA2
MIHSITIEGYRGFRHFTMEGLGRLNLLVGTNNSGKTSVLEALYLLTSKGDPLALWNLLWRRGERLPGTTNPGTSAELDVCHLFYGHDVRIGSKFVLSATNETPARKVAFTIGEFKPPTPKDGTITLFDENEPVGLALAVKGTPHPPVARIPLTRAGGISTDTFNTSKRLRRRSAIEGPPAQFITAESLDGDDLVALWDKVALTTDEPLAMRALQFLDPNIERIASQSSAVHYLGSHAGFIIKLKDHARPIPIGTMGDGMWRMLALAIAITQCKGGVLLVDEIDTGLHYSVMSDMWRLILGAARELDVQVFATTHSYDCIQSLGAVCMTETDQDVTLQRIEAGKSTSVPYSQHEIIVASDREIEVR